jgi:PhoPQ-activated pathogenicity-related protein
MVDPWIYRDTITVPKMIINGANDPYWPLDALNSYWDDLKGEKYLLYVPNAGHDLREMDKDGAKQLLPNKAVNTLAAFCKCQVFDKPMPKWSWQIDAKPAEIGWTTKFDSPWRKQRLHMAESATRDFRKSRWSDQLFVASKDGVTNRAGMTLRRPASGFGAGYMEMEFDVDGLPLSLTTQLRILEAKK